MTTTLSGGVNSPSGQFLTPLNEPRQLWVVGFGRSGTNWLTRLFMDVLDIYDAATDGPTKPGVIGRLHWIDHRPPGGKVCFIYRDPRDMIVSMMHFWRLPGIDEVLYPTDQPDLLPTLADYFRVWLMELEPEGVTRYERLLKDTVGEFSKLMDRLMIEYEPDHLEAAVKRQTFGAAKARLEENQPHRARQLQTGTMGKWRQVLNQDQGMKIDYWLGDWMHRMGYEREPKWWTSLPS